MEFKRRRYVFDLPDISYNDVKKCTLQNHVSEQRQQQRTTSKRWGANASAQSFCSSESSVLSSIETVESAVDRDDTLLDLDDPKTRDLQTISK